MDCERGRAVEQDIGEGSVETDRRGRQGGGDLHFGRFGRLQALQDAGGEVGMAGADDRDQGSALVEAEAPAEDVRCGAREAYSPQWQSRDPQDPKDRDWLWRVYRIGFRVVMEE